MAEHIGIIYCLKDPRNFEIRYIGQTIQNKELRLKQHLQQSIKYDNHLGNWLNNLVDTPLIEKLEECSYEELNKKELHWINYYKGNRLVNSMLGCEISGHHTHSDESKRKIGLSSTQRQFGRKLSEETKQKISKAHKGLRCGYKVPKEVIDRIVKSREWYKPNKETKRKIGMANKGRKWSEEHKEKFSEVRTKILYVYNIETKNIEKTTVISFAKKMNVTKQSIDSRLHKYYGRLYRSKYILSYSVSELKIILKQIGITK